MRQDPDVILVGEMRDAETVKAALAAAETGHFVMSTLHTTDAAETINRIIDFFPPHEQKQIRLDARRRRCAASSASASSRAPTATAAASTMEICVNTGRIADAIADPDKTRTITQLIGEGAYYGMQTFDQHLVSLIRDGVITLEAAMLRLDQPARPHGRAAPPRPRRLSQLLVRSCSSGLRAAEHAPTSRCGSTWTTIRRRHCDAVARRLQHACALARRVVAVARRQPAAVAVRRSSRRRRARAVT